jgi:hypothetical protein
MICGTDRSIIPEPLLRIIGREAKELIAPRQASRGPLAMWGDSQHGVRRS